MATTWHALLTNVAIIAIVTSVWPHLQHLFSRRAPRMRALAFGALMSAGVTAVMLMPVEFRPGVVLDLRYTFLSIAGFFGGGIAVLLPFTLACLLRIAEGGRGLEVGLPLILTASTIGVIGHRVMAGRVPEFRDIVVLASATAFSGIAGFFVMVPLKSWAVVFPEVVAPLAVLLFVATSLAAFALAIDMRWQNAMNDNHLYRTVIEALPDCLNAKDLQGRFIAANPATVRIMGAASVSALKGRTDFDFYSPEAAENFKRDEDAFLVTARPVTIEQTFRAANGDTIWLSTLKAPLRDEHGTLIGLITHSRKITEQKMLELQIELLQLRLSEALASMADGLVMFDPEGVLTFGNEQHRLLFPLTADVRHVGANLRDILATAIERGEELDVISGSTDDRIERLYASILREGDREMRLADGRFLQVRTRRTSDGGCLLVISDVTNAKNAERQLLRLNQQLESMANTDGLTRLLNRRAFDRLLPEAVDAAGAAGRSLGLFLIDIDRFKAFNDTYGHPAGDTCLRAVSEGLKTALKGYPRATIARYGGEEIAVIVPGADETEAFSLAEALRVAVRSLCIPHVGSEKDVVTISLGIAVLPPHQTALPDDLLRCADAGLYAGKAAGRDCVRMTELSAARAALSA